MFLPLTQAEIKQIAKLLLRKVQKNLAYQDLKIDLSEQALDLLAQLGYDPQFGARPLKRVIEKELVNELAKQVLAGAFTAGETIYIDTEQGKLTFSEKPFDPDRKREPLVLANQEQAKKNRRSRRREKQVEQLEQATKDVEDAAKDLKKKGPQTQIEEK